MKVAQYKYITCHRRGTKEDWEKLSTLIPLEGEIVIEIDEVNWLHKLKIGDGIHTYAELAYLQAGDEIITQALAEVKPRIVTVELTDTWTQDADGRYSQVLALDNITKRSRLDLQPSLAMLAEFKQLGLIFVTENRGGVITVCSDGNTPTQSYTMQATIVETECDGEDNVIIGTPIVTGGGSGGGGGDTTYTNTEPLLSNLGGILAKNHPNGFDNVPINDLLTELLYPYTAPVINSFTLNPAAGVKEKNQPLVVNSATVKATKKSKEIASVALYRGNELIETKTDTIESTGTTLTFDINDTLNGATDTSYIVAITEVGDDANTITSEAKYSFVHPYYYGVISGNTTVDSDVILGFTKSVRAKGSHSHTYTTSNQRPVIAYPQSYGELKSIIDPNNFAQNWTKSIVEFNDNTTLGVPYYVYVGGISTATTTYKFNY
jgi:hypothetical protein